MACATRSIPTVQNIYKEKDGDRHPFSLSKIALKKRKAPSGTIVPDGATTASLQHTMAGVLLLPHARVPHSLGGSRTHRRRRGRTARSAIRQTRQSVLACGIHFDK